MTSNEQVHFQILCAIESKPNITQRELARQLGVSKGKLGKIAYLLTAEGIKNRTALTRNYLARKEAEYQALKAEIQALRKFENQLPGKSAAADGKRVYPELKTL